MLVGNMSSQVPLQIRAMVTKRTLKLLICLVFAKVVAVIPEALAGFQRFAAILTEVNLFSFADF